MLFHDPSCISENTIKSQMENRIPEFLGSDWFGIIILTHNFKFKIDSKYDINKIGDDIVLDFLTNHRNNLFQQDFEYRLYEYKTNYFAIIPIRSADTYVVFFIHCRTQASGPFIIKDLEWNKVYAQAAYKTVLLNNVLVQEHDYLENVLDSTESVIVIFDLDYQVISLNKIAEILFNLFKPALAVDNLNIQDTEKLKLIFKRVILSGKKEFLNNLIVKVNGRDHILDSTISPLRNSKNVICGIILVGNDITKNQILEYELDQLKHYGLLGEIALGLSHDVKNPLTNIRGCAAFLKRSENIQDAELTYLNLIIQEVDRIDSIINQMMSFGNVVKNDTYTLLNINDVIYNSIQIINRQKVCRSIDVRYDLDKEIPLIKAKNTDLQQILLNILINSLQAIESDGVIKIKSKYHNKKESLNITISDTGVGIENDILDKLFNPYFTTKSNGTGLGLFIVKKVLDKYNGKIKIKSTPRKGTICKITFPTTIEINDINRISKRRNSK